MTPILIARVTPSSPRSPGWPAGCRRCGAGCRRRRRRRPPARSACPAGRRVTPATPRRCSAPATAWPWGSRISGLGITSTTTLATTSSLRWWKSGPMQVTHFGHSCVLLDTGAARLLIDPGNFSPGFEDVDRSRRRAGHPPAPGPPRPRAPARPAAGQPGRAADRRQRDGGAARDDVEHEVVEPGATVEIAGARVEVLGGQHAMIHPDIPRIVNNGYLVDGTHFHPGDALDTVPAGAARGAVPADGGAVAEAGRRRHLPARGGPARRRCRSTRGSSRCRGCTTATSSAWARRRPR